MNPFVHRLTRIDHFLAKGEALVLITLVVVMTVVVLLQVIYRYLLTQPLHWSEELARYLFVWISLLGAALSVQRRGHFGMDFFFRMLPDKGRRFLTFVIYLLMGVVVLVLLIQGIVLVEKTAAQQSPAMEISMGWAYACLPAGALLMAIHLLVIIIKEVVKKTETASCKIPQGQIEILNSKREIRNKFK
jgi:TRAP-type transport system small permease protein